MTATTAPRPPAALCEHTSVVAGHQVTGTHWRPASFANRRLSALADATRRLGNGTDGVYAFAWTGRRVPTHAEYARYLPDATGGLYSGIGRNGSGHRLSGASVVFNGWFQVRDRGTLVRMSPESGLVGLPAGVIIVSFPPRPRPGLPDDLPTLPSKVRSEDLAWLAYHWMRAHARTSQCPPPPQP